MAVQYKGKLLKQWNNEGPLLEASKEQMVMRKTPGLKEASGKEVSKKTATKPLLGGHRSTEF